MERFMRKGDRGEWQVHVGGSHVGDVWEAVMGGHFANGEVNVYGDTARIGWYESREAAARAVAEAHADMEEQRGREAEAEAYAEFGSSYVFGGGRPEDVGAAWAQHTADYR